ncbi:hypothetical protein [Pseudodesulfovibrio sp. zrk46]|uniref:hypothetical protein n=1 Tax=Pseudodesulfovibrio sp. zrk46 TaxID=2725288 RepID=UPI0014490FC0|nr:hypothetical protein [Pseudodesulfovibrio sp. zrk46]QJB57999.1 hypothetical protein HFN16_17105 [Pseudodesulfovibrio sp. zrk46]
MLDTSTPYLLLAMATFIFVAIALVHHHKNGEIIRRKKGEVEDYVARLSQKIDILEQDIVDLRMKSDDLDDEIETFKAGQ